MPDVERIREALTPSFATKGCGSYCCFEGTVNY